MRANIRVRWGSPEVICLRDSNFRISNVAPTPNSSYKKFMNVDRDKPSSTGIERSRRTTLVKSESNKIDWRNNDRPTQMALLSRRHQHRHVHQLQIGSHNPNIQGLASRNARKIKPLALFDSHLVLEVHGIRTSSKSLGGIKILQQISKNTIIFYYQDSETKFGVKCTDWGPKNCSTRAKSYRRHKVVRIDWVDWSRSSG